MRFTTSQRLRRTADFQEVRSKGRAIDCGSFLFSFLSHAGETGEPLRRLGVIASRRVGNAVRRNFAKRRLREVFRLHQANLPEACDVVMIARRRVLNERFAETEERFLKACRRIVSRPTVSKDEP